MVTKATPYRNSNAASLSLPVGRKRISCLEPGNYEQSGTGTPRICKPPHKPLFKDPTLRARHFRFFSFPSSPSCPTSSVSRLPCGAGVRATFLR